MSATRDQSSSSEFMSSPLYPRFGIATGVVLRRETLREPAVRSASPEDSRALGIWSRAEDLLEGKRSLARRLGELREARKRLNYLLGEMDELLKKD